MKYRHGPASMNLRRRCNVRYIRFGIWHRLEHTVFLLRTFYWAGSYRYEPLAGLTDSDAAGDG